jgi:hypothetical protein
MGDHRYRTGRDRDTQPIFLGRDRERLQARVLGGKALCSSIWHLMGFLVAKQYIFYMDETGRPRYTIHRAVETDEAAGAPTIIALCFAVGCSAQQPRDADLLASLRSAGCNPAITAISPDLSGQDAGLLATVARRAVATADGRARGIVPADTSILDSAVVLVVSLPFPKPEPTRYYCGVSFRPHERSTSISVHIDRVTGKMDVAEEEPLCIWPTSWRR